MKIYGLHGETLYNVEREKLFAESIINGEHSYMLRAYGCNQYQLEESQPIDQAYRK